MKSYLNFIKIEHTLFSLPIVFSGTLLAVFLNPQEKITLSWVQVLWILLAVTGARSYGFGVNRILDRHIDVKNPRTKNREIPAGKISVRSAWIFSILSAGLFLFSAGMLSKICFWLSFIPLGLFTLYPLLKRWTIWTHLGLGIAWGIAPLGGWLAVRPQIFPFASLMPALLLALFCIFWVAGFDIIYALLDESFDRQNQVQSMPAVLGAKNALRISDLFHLVAFLLLGLLVEMYLNHPLAFVVLFISGFLFIVSHWKVASQELTPQVIDFAFFKINAVLGFTVLGLIVTKIL
jgi:4-hydroxybenzoate polyprenyltransferase